MGLDEKTIAALAGVTTATLTTVLHKKGLRNVWLRGAKPLRPGQPRLVGPAFTLRFVPAREDLATPESWASPISTRAAIEAMPPGCVAVVDAMGVTDAGIFGDILCDRMQRPRRRRPHHRRRRARPRRRPPHRSARLVQRRRRARLRRRPHLRRLAAAHRLRRRSHLPRRHHRRRRRRRRRHPRRHSSTKSSKQPSSRSSFEAWIVAEVQAGVPLPGLYPANAETKARYEAFRNKARNR